MKGKKISLTSQIEKQRGFCFFFFLETEYSSFLIWKEDVDSDRGKKSMGSTADKFTGRGTGSKKMPR